MPESDSQDSPLNKLTERTQFIKGVGPARAELLAKLGLHTAADILFFFPRSYEDFTQLNHIRDLGQEQLATVVAEVSDKDESRSNGRHITYVLFRQDNSFLRATWFNQPFMLNKFRIGQKVMLQGKSRLQNNRQCMTHPKVTLLDDDETIENQQTMLPVYRLTEGINQKQMRKLVASTVEQCAHLVTEALPESLRKRTGIVGIAEAIKQIHSPLNQEEVDQARARLVYQELFILQLALAIRRHRVRSRQVATSLELTPKIKSRILGRLPFQLTESQQVAFSEIADDMKNAWPMNRLLHGEVGSGKTAVALCAMLTAVAHGHQAVLMAPTEILARQHLRSIRELLQRSRVRIELWSGSVKTARRKQIAADVESGEINIIVGTQAVVASQLPFQNLGLVVIDEQHKFGVKQRARLKHTGPDPHYLVMTATPIPRTVSMTLFGDLDVSTLERTSGVGQKVNTYLGNASNRDSWMEFVRKKLREGRQAFVVAPLVDGDDEQNLGSAERIFEQLSNGPLEEFRLDILHGRQSIEEKEAAMLDFESGKTQVIVATTVVEVGINVPNATVMTIESAERFGLSQLHQLRGRVSRGSHPGYVCLFASDNNAEENERLKAFSETENGFDLAQRDLEIRGPGNLFSSQQSGFPPLMIADLIRDTDTLQRAFADARMLIHESPNLDGEEFTRLRQLVTGRYGKSLQISDVG
ncbi:ATP-dependent DNA helicase RecG [Mariniblastus fucicola]|uniref:ATP-dependent DNA helicase RecG n=1 Tax=Mariniblastus fucicola TaxID=980251 RepID=A0A5B9P3V4_9BACT|nr:ATP-dependent DNA helicase RecG [Mariniblastus fucicola]QEG20894.1 ATP-dependent DNA helicase RecG [Mariniblastus fucicola]